MSSKTKRCRICRVQKPKKEFHRNPVTGQHFRRCKDCPQSEEAKKILSKWRII